MPTVRHGEFFLTWHPFVHHEPLITDLNPGRTYTLTDEGPDSSRYYRILREHLERLLRIIPGEEALRHEIRLASTWKGSWRFLSPKERSVRDALGDLEGALSPFLGDVEGHLRSLSLAQRFDRTLRTSRDRHILFMLEIELTNRINRERFLSAPWRMALIAHCLRDFRTGCRSTPQDVEARCTHCDPDCFVGRGAAILEQHRIMPCISVSMGHGKLLSRQRKEHPDMAVLGIACVPELVAGMRLCESERIPAVGIPLDANRCHRWLGRCLETTFSLVELEDLVKEGPCA